ncbi:hypothetical protein AB4Y64_01645 [Lysobacter sp. TAF61]|uniref:hypothetical protein n=1 Tax=Lysobacter sp. TAF61 TaxID=3233072 RepID=UPI003F997CD7
MSSFLIEFVASTGLFAPLNARATAARATSRLHEWHDAAVPAGAIHHVHRQRDFGVGYGNSSGYASERHYTSDWMPSRFGFV